MSDAAEPVAVPVCYRHPDRETYIACQRCAKPICPDCMNSAAVGFQCPDCVKEGRKATRSGRTAYGGEHAANPALTSQVLVGINVLVWLAVLVSGDLVDKLALIPDIACVEGNQFGCTAIQDGVARGSVWQLVTSMFLHQQLWHIGFNMFALWMLGPQLELAMGRARFLAVYLFSGLAGSTAVYWLSDPNGATLGASGAIFGLLGALAVVAYKVGGDVRSILGWVGANLVITFLIPNISWQGHLGGLVGGALLAAVVVYAPKQRRNLVQWGGIALFALLLLVAIAIRTVVLQ